MSELNRIRITGYAFSLVAVFIVGRMFNLQNSAPGKALEVQADRQYEYLYDRLIPERGNIYDRWGHLLAGNKVVYELGVNLADSKLNPQTIAKEVSKQLKMDYSDILDRVSTPYVEQQTEYVVITDFVDSQSKTRLEEIQAKYEIRPAPADMKSGERKPSLSGIVFSPHLKRDYPENSLAANVIGFYSFMDRQKGSAHYGVEEKYDQLLAGTPVDVKIPLEPRKISDIPLIPPGASLVLTIDRNIQASVEAILDHAVKKNAAVSGAIVVEDPKTGEILAMATNPRMNPNEYWKSQALFDSKTFNRTVDTPYEPGSVFKVLTMASAMDAGAVQPDTPFLDTGQIEMGGITIYNWDRSAWGAQNMLTCMEHSLNVCLSWVAIKLGPTKFYEYLKAFGIGHRTNVDLSGEKTFPLAIPGDGNWYPVNLATNSFGQGLAVTPIQMVSAVSAVANDGKMMAPHILDAVVNNGQKTEIPPRLAGNPISPQTAHALSKMLSISLAQESYQAAQVEGYTFAGKTGTAEIPGDGGYLSNLTNASFVGWGPIDNPRFVIYVWLEKPKSSIWGSIVASPVFKSVAESLVVLMDIPPDAVRRQLTPQ
jgi:cell division protein FtsI/penicillin-binding protein 2